MESFGDMALKGPPSGVTPHLTVQGGLAAIDFYRKAFGAEEVFRQMADDGERVMHAHLRLNNGSIMLCDDFPEYRGGTPLAAPAGAVLHLAVTDADAVWNAAMKAGAEPVFPLEDQFWGERYGQIKDPFGHTWSIGAPVKG